MRSVLHVIETLSPHEGGPPRVVAALCTAQRARGIDAQVLCGDGPALERHLDFWKSQSPHFRAEGVHCFESAGTSLLALRRGLRAWLHRNLERYDIVHIHQLWRLVPTETALVAGALGVPYLIAPHTSLSPWALAQKRLKKWLARKLAWDRILSGATGFHALNEFEADEIRARLARDNPQVYVVSNGVFLEEFTGAIALPEGDVTARLCRAGTARAFVLFLARLHTMKGPDTLLEAFAVIAAQYPELDLVYAGPDYGMQAQLMARAATLGLGPRVHFPGLVSGAHRLWLLRQARCLAQPSRDEGFSLSILEALASARPVVISDRCKFPQVAASGAGVIVRATRAELASGLAQYAADAGRADADGRNARRLVEQHYTWDAVAAASLGMYGHAIASGRSGRMKQRA